MIGNHGNSLLSPLSARLCEHRCEDPKLALSRGNFDRFRLSNVMLQPLTLSGSRAACVGWQAVTSTTSTSVKWSPSVPILMQNWKVHKQINIAKNIRTNCQTKQKVTTNSRRNISRIYQLFHRGHGHNHTHTHRNVSHPPGVCTYEFSLFPFVPILWARLMFNIFNGAIVTQNCLCAPRHSAATPPQADPAARVS